jgi:signal-transduction protein with cAMP-binding, CBS, and nucleotidyltransferase domain/DNA polymerase III epsilon subunit-like protein
MTASAASALVALESVVIDTETTGLDVRRDRVIQIGGVRMNGADMDLSETFEAVVDPGVAIPGASSRVHGLTDADVAGKPSLARIMPEFSAFIGDRIVIGHSIHFDLAMLRHEAARQGFVWTQPRALDVALIAAGLEPGLVDTSLESLAVGLGVQLSGRHTAIGDALTTARVFAALQPRLLAAGIRTIGELESLCRRPAALIAQQEGAGWYDSIGQRPDFAHGARRSSGQRAIDSFLYRNRLSDVMARPLIAVAAGASLQDAARVMEEHGIGCVFIDFDEGPCGILTERDLLRALARADDPKTVTAGALATRPVISASADMHLYRALGFMARRNLRYLGVTDTAGRVEGVFTLRSLLRERALATLSVGDQIAEAERPRDLARAQAQLPALAVGLLEDGLDARSVAGIIAAEGRAMTARAAELSEKELLAAGAGPPPADYAVLVLGSGGRGESMLAPDQDNALVIADHYDGDLDSPSDWFTRFATRMNEILDRAGIPFCKGGVMARNRQWRRRHREWREQLNSWADRPSPQTLLNADIFYDFTPVHASSQIGAELAQQLRADAADIARHSLSMLRAMGEAAGSHKAPLGLFGRLRKDDQGRIDLKSGGLLPIVSGARAVALRQGVTALSTPERLVQAARTAGRSEEDAALLADIHGFLMRLILTQQVADIDAGISPSNKVSVAKLSHREHGQLREALSRVDLIQGMLRDLLQGF